MNKSLVNRQARKYVEANPKLKGVMDLYREIFAAQRRLSKRIPEQLPHLKGAQMSYRLQEGRVLIEPHELEIDISVLKEIIREMGRILDEKGRQAVENMDAFLEKELEDGRRLRGLVDAFLSRDEDKLAGIMREYTIDPSVLYLLLHVSLAPFLWKKAGPLARKADLDQVPRGSCPVCGDLPIMGFLRSQDGLRVLECSLCGSRWGVPRMMCPSCGTIEQSKLRYIFSEGDEVHRVYLCEQCGKYIKVTSGVDEASEELVVPLEDLATAHLDRAAEERGYTRGCRTAMS